MEKWREKKWENKVHFRSLIPSSDWWAPLIKTPSEGPIDAIGFCYLFCMYQATHALLWIIVSMASWSNTTSVCWCCRHTDQLSDVILIKPRMYRLSLLASFLLFCEYIWGYLRSIQKYGIEKVLKRESRTEAAILVQYTTFKLGQDCCVWTKLL